MSNKLLNVLHISDIHYQNDQSNYNQSVVLKSFFADLKNLRESNLTPDIIIVTGDLVYAADNPDIFYYSHDNFLSQISKLTGCSENRIFLCPGNHDASRNKIQEHRMEFLGLNTSLKTRDEINDAYLSGRLAKYINDVFADYKELEIFFGNGEDASIDEIYRIDRISALNLEIVSLNTAWLTNAGISDLRKDFRNLIIPEAAIFKAFDSLSPDSYKIILTHHPISWLSEDCEKDFRRAFINLGKGQHLHLFGHMHESIPESVSSLDGTILRVQAGALYQGRSRYNGYSLIQVSPERDRARVHLRSYYDARYSFDRGLDLTQDGIFYPYNADIGYWTARHPIIDRGSLSTWISANLADRAKEEYDEGLVGRPVQEIFVTPPMHIKTLKNQDDIDGIPIPEETTVTLDDIINSPHNFVIHGRPEYGKTTILRQLALRIIQSNKCNIPIVIDFDDISNHKDAILRILRHNIVAELDGLSLSDLLSEGLVTVLIDDVEFSDHHRIQKIRAFISNYNNNRYIITTGSSEINITSTAFGEHVVANLDTSVVFQDVFLSPFTRNKMRHLVEKWNFDHGIDREKLLNRVIKELTGLSIPLTAVNGVILLAIYDNQPDFAVVNRAMLVKRFIEKVLERKSPKEIIRGTFDYENKTAILSDVARYMCENNRYKLEYADFVAVIQKSLDHIGLNQNVEALLDEFISAKIVTRRSDGCLSFRYRAILEYFIAVAMVDQPEFFDWVLDESRYLQYINEIQYFAGLNRRDSRLLDTIGERFAVLTKRLQTETDWEPLPEDIQKFQPPRTGSEDDIFNHFERQMSAPPLTPPERDEVLQAEIPQDIEQRQEVFRPKLEHPGHEWTSLLLLYSGILKNLDMIPDVNKRTHLESIIAGWAYFTAQILSIIPMLAKHRRIIVNGVNYEVNAPHTSSVAEIANSLYLDTPNAVSRVVNWYLGTEKLEKQLIEPSLAEGNEPLIFQFFRISLIADLRLPGWPKILSDFGAKIISSRYLSESFLRKVTGIYLLGDYRKKDGEKLIDAGAELIANLRGHGKKDIASKKGTAKQKLKQRSLIQTLKIRSSDNP